MRRFGLLALAAAGMGFLLYSERGRQWMSQMGQCASDTYGRLRDSMSGETEVEEIVHQAIEQPHPDTAVARAFENAVA